MNASQIYILIAIIVFAIIAAIALFPRKESRKPISKMATFALIFVIAGIVFGENRLIGYSLMGVGIILVIIDIIKKPKQF